MKIGSSESHGFSAVELLITLFIAFLFIMMGYQLYGVTIASGGSTSAKSRASNLAYTQMRLSQETAPTAITCPSAPLVTNTSVDGGKGTQTVTISCPSTLLVNLRLVTVRVVYGSQQEEATHAVYVGQ
jgi:hypothetical protein